MNRAIIRYSCAVLSGLLLALSFPPFGWWPFAWLALAPLIAALRAAPDSRAAADLGGLAGFVFAAAALPWLTKVFGVWTPALWCIFGLGPGLWAALLKGLQGRLGDRVWVAAAGILWTALEAVRAHLPGLACPWLSLGFTASAAPELLQAGSVLGVIGLSAAMAAFGAALALAFEGRRLSVEIMLVAIGLSWAMGERRLEIPDSGTPARVALIQDESYDLERLAKFTLSPHAREADLVIWPEYQVAVNEGSEDSYRRLYARKVAGARGIVVVGAAIIPEDPKAAMQNFSWVLGSDGALLGRYDKAHPIPFVERRLLGHSDPRPISTPLGPLGLQICYDLDFEDGARLLARRGARILAVTNLDPIEWGPGQHAQHSAMAPLRAVESGLWLARAASSGTSQIIDSRGRVRAALGYGEAGVLEGEVRLAEGRTLYSLGGWLLIPLSLFALGVALLDAGQRLFRGQALAEYPQAAILS